jgi:hypothetical protein
VRGIMNERGGTPAHLLVAYISNWVAGRIVVWEDFSGDNLNLLHDLLEHCVRLEKYCPEHRYRLGAVLCLMNKKEAAQAMFAEASKDDSRSEFYDAQRIANLAAVHLCLAYRQIRLSDDGAAVTAVAFVMRALTLGGDYASAHIREKFTQTEYWNWKNKRKEYSVEEWTTTDRVLMRH